MIGYLYTFKKELREIPGPGYVERSWKQSEETTAMWQPGASMPVQNRVLKHIEYKHFVVDGENFCVGMDQDVKEALSFLWYEERDLLLRDLATARDDEAKVRKKFQTLRNDISAWTRMPWYKRVWAAYRRVLP